MDIEELFDKYIEEPKRRRAKIPGKTRLTYSLISQSYTKYFFFGISLPLVLGVLYFLNVIEKDTLGLILLWIFPSILYYSYGTRKCSKCDQKMFRQYVDDTLYYFCDNCKTKTETYVGRGD
jgi:hypothetical protein